MEMCFFFFPLLPIYIMRAEHHVRHVHNVVTACFNRIGSILLFLYFYSLTNVIKVTKHGRLRVHLINFPFLFVSIK